MEWLKALVETEPGDEVFIADMAKGWTVDEKMRVRAACEKIKGAQPDVWRDYCGHVLNWASVINGDNRWHLEEFNIVYEAHIDSHYIERIIVTAANVRLADSARGLVTFAEFRWIFGLDIEAHLRSYQQQRSSEIEEIIKHLAAKLVKKKVTVADSRGAQALEIVVLDSLEPEMWRLPEGFKLLDAGV